jgi:hypothetical protein
LDIFHSHPYHFSSRHQQLPSPPRCLLPSSADAPCTWRLHLSAWALAEPLGAGVPSSYPWHPSSPQRLAGRPTSHGASPSSLEIEQELSMMWIGVPAVSPMEHGAGSSYPWLNSRSTPSLLPCKLGFLPGAPLANALPCRDHLCPARRSFQGAADSTFPCALSPWRATPCSRASHGALPPSLCCTWRQAATPLPQPQRPPYSHGAPLLKLHADTPCSSSLYRRPPQNSKLQRLLHLPWKAASPHGVLVFSLLSLASQACCRDNLAAAPPRVLPARRYAQPAACGHAGVLRSACATPPICAAPTSCRRKPAVSSLLPRAFCVRLKGRTNESHNELCNDCVCRLIAALVNVTPCASLVGKEPKTNGMHARHESARLFALYDCDLFYLRIWSMMCVCEYVREIIIV